MANNHGIYTYGIGPRVGRGDDLSHYDHLLRVAHRARIQLTGETFTPWKGQKAELVMVAAPYLEQFDALQRLYRRRNGWGVRSALLLKISEKVPKDATHIVSTVVRIDSPRQLLEVVQCPHVLGLRHIPVPRTFLQLLAWTETGAEAWPTSMLPFRKDIMIHASECDVYRNALVREINRQVQENRYNLMNADELLWVLTHPEQIESALLRAILNPLYSAAMRFEQAASHARSDRREAQRGETAAAVAEAFREAGLVGAYRVFIPMVQNDRAPH